MHANARSGTTAPSARACRTSLEEGPHMDVADVLADGVDRVRQVVERSLDGVADATLTWQPDADSNTVAWLVWHLTRVQDDHVAEVAGSEQVWTADGWQARF